MYKINTNYQKLPGSYLFSNIAKKVSAFTEAHPDADIIRLGIGDVRRTTSPKDAISPWTKSSSPTGQRVIPAIFRRFLPRITASPYAIRYIRYMWTPM